MSSCWCSWMRRAMHVFAVQLILHAVCLLTDFTGRVRCLWSRPSPWRRVSFSTQHRCNLFSGSVSYCFENRDLLFWIWNWCSSDFMRTFIKATKTLCCWTVRPRLLEPSALDPPLRQEPVDVCFSLGSESPHFNRNEFRPSTPENPDCPSFLSSFNYVPLFSLPLTMSLFSLFLHPCPSFLSSFIYVPLFSLPSSMSFFSLFLHLYPSFLSSFMSLFSLFLHPSPSFLSSFIHLPFLSSFIHVPLFSLPSSMSLFSLFLHLYPSFLFSFMSLFSLFL